jgi:hypothetical protein
VIGRGNLLTSISFPSQDGGILTAVAVLCEWNGTDPPLRFAPGSLKSAGSEVSARSHPQVPSCGLSFCTRRGISTARL